MADEIKKPTGTLLDWLPGAKDLAAFEGIERELRSRKRSGNRWTFVLAALGVVYQLLVHFQGKDLGSLGKLVVGVLPDAWAGVFQQQPAAVGLVLLLAAALVFIAVRFTSLLLTLSREPFRYSFSVAPFTSLTGDRFALEAKDRLSLLPLDLTERLDKRIERLSLLRAPPAAGGAAEGPSHIAIGGEVALREDADGAWELFAMPRVRIGDAAAPETLSFSVSYPLPGELTDKGELAFSAKHYHQFCERVYASVALAIYQRIDADLEDKVAQFPTTFRRAVARLNEADDFAQSNTIDANERAEAQYLLALQELNRTWSLALARWARALQLPLAWYLRVFELHAAILAGMARCAVTRSINASLVGRPARPNYAVRAPLLHLVETLRPIQRRGARRSGASFAQRLVAARLPRFEVTRQARQRRQQRLTRALFDSLVALALAHTHAGEPMLARTRLGEAQAVDPDTAPRNREYLWIDADLRADLDGRIDGLRRLMDLAPDFQIGQFQLAVALEMRMRALDQVTPEGARAAIAEYERVLAINPGNVGALASLGYLHWVLEAFEPAQRRFEEGLALREVVRETFVGELNYGLARVWAEKPPGADAWEDARQLHRALACFEIAVETEPDLATSGERSERGSAAGELNFIGATLLGRFDRYRRNVAQRLRRPRASRDGRVVAMRPALARLHGFVLNDAGNAALQFHVRMMDPTALRRAGRLFNLALQVWPHCAAVFVNRDAYTRWADRRRSLADLDAAHRLAPDWQRPRIERLALSAEQQRAARGQIVSSIQRLEQNLAGAGRQTLPRPADAAQAPALASLALQQGPAPTGPYLTEQGSEREDEQARTARIGHELDAARSRLKAHDDRWRDEVHAGLSNLLRRFPLGRLIDGAGALPSDRRPRPFSSHLADPTVDIERLSPAEQDLLLAALTMLSYLADAEPDVVDEVLRCCTALGRRLSDESWGWVNLACELLEHGDEEALHPADRRELKQARQRRLALVWRSTESDPVHSNALDWLLRLHADAVAADEVERSTFDAVLKRIVRTAEGPLATAPVRRGLARRLLKLSIERIGDDPRPGHPDGDRLSPEHYWRLLARAARRLAHPRDLPLRAVWADWYGKATSHLVGRPGGAPLRRLRLAEVAAGRVLRPQDRRHWWRRCAEMASDGLIGEPDRYATRRVDFAGWYARAVDKAGAIDGDGPGGGNPREAPSPVVNRVRKRFFDSEPPRDVGVTAVTVLLDQRLVELVAGADYQLTPQVEAAIEAQRIDWQQRLGITMPPLNFRVAGAGMLPGGWGLLLREVATVQGRVDFDAATPALEQLMAQVQAELEARLPALVGLQDIHRLLAAADGELADTLTARAGALPRLLALAQALLAQGLPLDVVAMARLVLDEAAPDFDRLVVRARAIDRVRQRLVARAADAALWALPQALQQRLLDFIDGAGDSRCLALWPDDARAFLAAVQARAPEAGVLGIVIDEPLLLAGVTATQHLSNQPALVLLRGELPLPQQFALKGEIADVPLAGANTGTR